MILKITGALGILLASAGYGYSKGLEYRKCVEELEALEHLIRQMAGEISYTRAPLSEVCVRIKEQVCEPYRTWLEEMAHGLEERGAENLRLLWETPSRKMMAALMIEQAEQEEFCHLGSRMGALDIRMQEQTLLRYADRLEEKKRQQRASLPEKRRLCNLLGMTGGIFLVILLL